MNWKTKMYVFLFFCNFQELLEDESIFKVGVAPFDDAKYLLNDYSVALKSTLDLRHIVELTGHTTGGLAFLAQSELNVVLDKSWRVRDTICIFFSRFQIKLLIMYAKTRITKSFSCKIFNFLGSEYQACHMHQLSTYLSM